MVEADSPAESQHVYRTRALGSIAELVTDARALFAASEMLEQELERIDLVASRFRSDSELSRLNAAAGSELVVSHDLFEAIDVALAMAEATDGLVDPTVGAAMNLLGYDRDFADVRPGVEGELPPEQAVPGWRSVSVDPEPTVRAAGAGHLPRPRRHRQGVGCRPSGVHHPRPARVWRARLARRRCLRSRPGTSRRVRQLASPTPAPLPSHAEAVAISSGGLATSGIGVRQWRLGAHQVHHIVDPVTGLSAAPCWRTVSAAAATCVQANAASTAAIVLGERAVDWLESSRAPGATRAARRDRRLHRRLADPRVRSVRAGVEHPMTASLLATVGHGSTALWYLTRATGLVSLILLSATVVLGTVASVGWTSDRWPRFLSQSVHRNLSLFCIALIGVHVVTTVGDGYVPIGLADADHPVPLPLSPDLGGARGGGVRHAPGRRDHERAAPPHRRGCLAGSPLAGLRLLADRRAPRPGLGLRRPASRGDARVRPLHRPLSPPRWPGVWRQGGRAR